MELYDYIEKNPDKVGGEPLFKNTRVPVRIMYEYLEAGDSLDRFLEHYPSVNSAQARSVLELTKQKILNSHSQDAA